MSKIETVKIGDVTVVIHKKTVRQGLRLQAKIISILGKGAGKALAPLVSFAMNTKGTGSTSDVNDIKDTLSESFKDFDFSKLSESLSDIIGSLDADTVDSLIDELVNGVFVDGLDLSDADKFELAFADKYDLLYKVLAKILIVQFKGFFSFLSTFNGSQKEESTPTK